MTVIVDNVTNWLTRAVVSLILALCSPFGFGEDVTDDEA